MLLADTAIIGHLGTPELGGLAAASVVLGTVVGLCVFLAYGSTASVARHHGAGDERAAYSLAISSLWLAAGLGVVLGRRRRREQRGAGRAPCPARTGWPDSPRTTCSISALGVPAMLLLLAATGALRGVLDLRTPLIATIAANIVNVVLNVVFVYGLDWSVQGAAAGTVIAQWLAAGWLVVVVVRRARPARASTRPARRSDPGRGPPGRPADRPHPDPAGRAAARDARRGRSRRRLAGGAPGRRRPSSASWPSAWTRSRSPARR